MPLRTKTPLEVRRCPFNMGALIASGAVLSSVQAFASREAAANAPLGSTTLAAGVTAGDTTIQLNADPGAGALLILDPGGGAEERLKVISVSGTTAPFTATVTPVAWFDHSTSPGSVSFEYGLSARMLADDTPTPVSPTVTLTLQAGAHGQTYRVSVVGTCNNGEIVEDEIELLVSDVAPTETTIKQPTETRDLAAAMALLLSEAHQSGATILSRVVYASKTTATSTSLDSSAAANAATLSLVANPGVGALLVVDPTGEAERVYVSDVSGTGPYTATIHPTNEFQHDAGTGVTVYGGVSANFLTAAAAPVIGTDVLTRGRRGAHGQTVKLVWVATTDQGEQLQHSGLVSIQEVT